MADRQHGGRLDRACALSPCRTARWPSTERAAVGERRRPWSRGYDPVVQAVGRVPAKVHTKLLIAFVGTSVLLVAVGLLGLRVLGQSNGRVGSLGSLQERAVGYARLQQDAKLVRELLAQNAGLDYSGVWPGATPLGSGRKAIPVDQAIADAADRIGPETAVDRLGFTPTAADAVTLGLDPPEGRPALHADAGDHQTRQERPSRRGAQGPPPTGRSARAGICIRMPPCSPTESPRRSTT